MKDNQTPIEFEESSGNVFADLGLEDAEDLYVRSQLGFHVYQILKAMDVKQREIAELLGISQPDTSHLMNGHFSRFSTDKLLNFLKRLNKKVTFTIADHRNGEPYQVVDVAV